MADHDIRLHARLFLRRNASEHYHFRLCLMGRFARLAHTIRNKLIIQKEGRKTNVVCY